MSKKRYKTPILSDEKKEYDDNLRIRTITGSTPRDEDPNAPFSPQHMRIWEVLEYWNVSTEAGLDEKEVKRKRKRFGTNVVFPYLSLSFSSSLRSQLHTSMSWLFVASCVLMYIFEKNIVYILSAAFAVLLFIINAVIEANAASALEVSRKYSTLKCVVRRDGKDRIMDSRSLVPGDIIILGTGSIVPADARLTESNDFRVSEAPVFGSYGVSEKNALYVSGHKDSGSMPNMVYAGSIVAAGNAIAVVCATGKALRIRKKRGETEKDKKHRPTLLEYAHKVSNRLSLISVVMCFVAVFLGALFGYDIATMFMLSVGTCFISLSDTVNTIACASLAFGIREMLDKGIALRNLNCIPELCDINSVMCDHSAAFPTRKMAAATVFTGMRLYNIESGSKARIQKVLTRALVCSDVKYEYSSRNRRRSAKLVGPKQDVAITKAAHSLGISLDDISSNYFRISTSYNKRSEIERVLVLEGANNTVVLKGTPEFVLQYCVYYEQLGELYPIDQKVRNRLLDAAYEMGEKSQRVIAIAEKRTDEDNLNHPSTARDFVFVGFIGLYVSLEIDSASAVYRCANADIETVVRTNESYHSAVSLAKNAGIIKDETQAIRSSELAQIDPGIYIADLPKYKLFVGYDDKQWRDVLFYRKEEGKNVALQVRSLSELPAMSMADITIAGDGEGSETLRQCADVITLKDGFDVIAHMLARVKTVYKRINATVQFGAVSFSAFSAALIISVLAGVPIPFGINELLIAGVIINFLILVSIAAEPESSIVLKQRLPKYKPEPRLRDFLTPAIYGIGIGIGMIFNYHIGNSMGADYTAVLIGIVLSLFLYAFSDVSGVNVFSSGGIRNYFLVLSFVLASGLCAFILYIPTVAPVFGYTALSPTNLAISIAFPVTQFVLLNMFRLIRRALVKNKPTKRRRTGWND